MRTERGDRSPDIREVPPDACPNGHLLRHPNVQMFWLGCTWAWPACGHRCWRCWTCRDVMYEPPQKSLRRHEARLMEGSGGPSHGAVLRASGGYGRSLPAVRAPTVTVDHAETECLVTLTGDIDMTSVPDIQKVAKKELAHCPDNAPTVVVDLARVTFLDSSGLGALVALLVGAKERGQELVLRGSSPRIKQLLRLTGLDQAFRTL